MEVLNKQLELEIGKFSGHPINYTYHIILPNDIATALKDLKLKRVQVDVNGKLSFHKPILSYEGIYYMTLAATDRKKLKVDVKDKIQVVFKKDESKYQIEIAEEMKELLKQDPEADKFFHQLTPGKQRSLLYIVNKVKSSDLRLRKSLVIIDHLKANEGKLDFKMLNMAMKND